MANAGKWTMKKFKFRPRHRCDGDGPTNAKRAAWAEAGVHGFLAATGEPDVINEDSIKDVLADLLHLCDREGVDGHKLLRTAKHDWEHER